VKLLRLLSSILFILIIANFLAAEETPTFHPVSGEGYQINDGKIYLRYSNTGLILEIATERSIANYYLDRGIQLGNPFRDMGGGQLSPTIFLITLLNRGKGTISFTPSYVAMKSKNESFFPMNFGELWDFISNLDPPIQKVMQKSIYHSPENVHPGEVITKLLIFPAIPHKMTDFTLDFDFLYLENHEMHPVFYFTSSEKKK
jgi:hypothetical protein